MKILLYIGLGLWFFGWLYAWIVIWAGIDIWSWARRKPKEKALNPVYTLEYFYNEHIKSVREFLDISRKGFRIKVKRKRRKEVIAMDKKPMNFSEALNAVKEGRAIQREGWNGKGMYVRLQMPDTNSKMSLPYLYMNTADDRMVPWIASQTDILAGDWIVLY